MYIFYFCSCVCLLLKLCFCRNGCRYFSLLQSALLKPKMIAVVWWNVCMYSFYKAYFLFCFCYYWTVLSLCLCFSPEESIEAVGNPGNLLLINLWWYRAPKADANRHERTVSDSHSTYSPGLMLPLGMKCLHTFISYQQHIHTTTDNDDKRRGNNTVPKVVLTVTTNIDNTLYSAL